MGSLSLYCNAIPAQSIKLGFHHTPNCLATSPSLNLQSTSVFRFKNAGKLVTSIRLPFVRATNKPSEESIGKTDAITSGDTSTPQGPPFLTILAGIVAFALLLWVVGSIVSWLIGLLSLLFSK